MFRPDDIQARLHERPFRPFRIIASEGQVFNIHHPELVVVGVRDMLILFPRPDHPTAYDRVTRVALVHVVSLEDLPTPAGTPDSGQT
jgi:hypothetical protein